MSLCEARKNVMAAGTTSSRVAPIKQVNTSVYASLFDHRFIFLFFSVLNKSFLCCVVFIDGFLAFHVALNFESFQIASGEV